MKKKKISLLALLGITGVLGSFFIFLEDQEFYKLLEYKVKNYQYRSLQRKCKDIKSIAPKFINADLVALENSLNKLGADLEYIDLQKLKLPKFHSESSLEKIHNIIEEEVSLIKIDHFKLKSIGDLNIKNKIKKPSIKFIPKYPNNFSPYYRLNIPHFFSTYDKKDKEVLKFLKSFQEVVENNTFLHIHLKGQGGYFKDVMALLSAFYTSTYYPSSNDQRFPLPKEKQIVLGNDLYRKLFFEKVSFDNFIYNRSFDEFKFFSKLIVKESYVMRFNKFNDKAFSLRNPDLKIIVTADRNCSSSCELFLMSLIKDIGAIFVGEETSGSYSFGAPGYLIMENICTIASLPTTRQFIYDRYNDILNFQKIKPDILSNKPVELVEDWIGSGSYLKFKSKKSIVEEIKKFRRKNNL